MKRVMAERLTTFQGLPPAIVRTDFPAAHRPIMRSSPLQGRGFGVSGTVVVRLEIMHDPQKILHRVPDGPVFRVCLRSVDPQRFSEIGSFIAPDCIVSRQDLQPMAYGSEHLSFVAARRAVSEAMLQEMRRVYH